jgi:hypothetical protein
VLAAVTPLQVPTRVASALHRSRDPTTALSDLALRPLLAVLSHSRPAEKDGGFNGSLQHRPKSIGRRFKPQGFSGALV